MSKINRDQLYEQVAEMIQASKDKNRKFTESVELQVRK
jgi:ribosomal protein L1